MFHIAKAHSRDMTEERVRTVMGSLGLTGQMPLRQIGALSGGEKARVVLSAFVLRPANCLLLDEPSNHLDMAALKALTAGLKDWSGALLAITHNRAFCSDFRPTHILRVSNGSASLKLCIDGEIRDEDFWEDGAENAAAAGGGRASGEASTSGGGAAAAAAAAPPAPSSFEERKRLQKARARIDKLMQLIEAAETKLATIDADVRAQCILHHLSRRTLPSDFRFWLTVTPPVLLLCSSRRNRWRRRSRRGTRPRGTS